MEAVPFNTGFIVGFSSPTNPYLLVAGYFVEITIKPQIFHASVGKIQLSRFCFSDRNFQRCFSIISFSIYIFCTKNFKFRLSSFCWQIPTFTLPLFKFLLSNFSFSSVYFQTPTFRFLLAIPIFKLLHCKFSASCKLHF